MKWCARLVVAAERSSNSTTVVQDLGIGNQYDKPLDGGTSRGPTQVVPRVGEYTVT